MDLEDSKEYHNFVSGVYEMVNSLRRENDKTVDTKENMEGN